MIIYHIQFARGENILYIIRAEDYILYTILCQILFLRHNFVTIVEKISTISKFCGSCKIHVSCKLCGSCKFYISCKIHDSCKLHELQNYSSFKILYELQIARCQISISAAHTKKSQRFHADSKSKEIKNRRFNPLNFLFLFQFLFQALQVLQA